MRELEPRHWCAIVGITFTVLSPFLAIARVEAGWLSFIVGMLAISLAAICERRWGQPPTNVLILHNASQSPTLRQPIDSARIRCPRRGWNIG